MVARLATLLETTRSRLKALEGDETLMNETPVEVWAGLSGAIESLSNALLLLPWEAPAPAAAGALGKDRPTRQQGQFLAFIREFMLRNEAGVAPSHAEFQRFFDLTPPSVNSMLIRLEQRGFIRRVPHRARALELTLPPEWIPPLERPFRF